MNDESIISDGTLTIGSNAVTWFTFLQVSRLTNSEQKGWNFKRGWHWSKRGLDQMVPVNRAAKFVGDWTRNSRNQEALPEPREDGFQFEDRLDAFKNEKRGATGTPKEEAENRINWGLSLNLHKSGRTCFYEVPLAKEQKGQLKADVMIFHDAGRIEIIELKCSGRKNPDTPLMALTEAICYAIQTTRCWPNLAKEVEKLPGAKSLGELREIHLILAAPDYWNNCNPGRGETRRITGPQVSKLRAIVTAVGANLPGVELSLSLADIGEDGLGLKKASIGDSPEPPAWSVLSSDRKARSPS